MRSLSDFLNDKQTETFAKHGAFFAFSAEQANKHIKEGIAYVALGQGLISPKENAEALTLELNANHVEAIQADIKENGIKAIIHRELANYECQITMDYSDAIEALEPYGITDVQVAGEWEEYFAHCVKNDYF